MVFRESSTAYSWSNWIYMSKSVPNLHQCVRCGMIGHDQCALKCKHCGGDHSPSECKAQTNSLAVPPVAFSTSQEQVSGVAEDQEAAPRDNEGSAQPQPEPTSERMDFSRGKSRRWGCNQLRPPTLLAAAELSLSSPTGAPGTSPADTPAAEDQDDNTRSWTGVV
ncbi:hypothetical protein MRX96_031101 [Rhipicephalus microplus]